MPKSPIVCRIAALFLCFGASVATAATAATPPAQLPIPELSEREGPIPTQPASVALVAGDDGGWTLEVDGKAFPIRGAGGAQQVGMLEQLAVAGGNCVRTWGIDTMEQRVNKGERFIDRAYRLGVMVVPGLWIGHKRHGFDYGNPEHIAKQRAEVLAAVRRYKDHPAVLMWGLGNEMEGVTSAAGDADVYQELEELAKLIKQEDPHHPIITIVAGSSPAKAQNFMRYCPSIDVYGINTYSGAAGAGEMLNGIGFTKPFAVTEFGVSGHWEVAKTPWGAPIEPTSQEKSVSYRAAHVLVTQRNVGHQRCLGTFAFLWGWKQEMTATWYGMYLPTLEKLPQVDAMTKAWTGAWPANRCPRINGLTSDAKEATVAAGVEMTAEVAVVDKEGDTLTYHWSLLAETSEHGVGGEWEPEAQSFSAEHIIDGMDGPRCRFRTPAAGMYRLFVTVHDGHGGAATANFPFQTR